MNRGPCPPQCNRAFPLLDPRNIGVSLHDGTGPQSIPLDSLARALDSVTGALEGIPCSHSPPGASSEFNSTRSLFGRRLCHLLWGCLARNQVRSGACRGVVVLFPACCKAHKSGASWHVTPFIQGIGAMQHRLACTLADWSIWSLGQSGLV